MLTLAAFGVLALLRMYVIEVQREYLLVFHFTTPCKMLETQSILCYSEQRTHQ